MPTFDVDPWLEVALAEGAADPGRDWLSAARERVRERGFSYLEVHLASLPRRFGKSPLPAARLPATPGLDASVRRSCDAAAAALLREGRLSGDELVRLFRQGDQEERRMILSSLPLLEDPSGAAEILIDTHRSNDGLLFEVGMLDSDIAATVLEQSDWNNAVMKVAFLDFALERLRGYEARCNPSLSRMLLDFMAEREAAGRPIWGPSLEMAARAAVPGVTERLLGDLWHGVDRRRLAAVRGARQLDTPALRDALARRRDYETHPVVLEELAR